ncbi:hypothetical protein BCR42DRAFT_414768, partial [Absidia repens]
MQPSLSELTSVLAGEIPKPKCKPLCENIFDVPRSNLLDVLEDLQNAFWSDEPPAISVSTPMGGSSSSSITIAANDTTTIEKQARTRQQEPIHGSGQSHKRLRLTAEPSHLQQQQQQTSSSTTGNDYDQQPTSPSPPSSPGRPMVSEPVYAKDVNKQLPALTTHNNNISIREDDMTPPMNLWTIKWQIFKQLKSINHDYKEKQVIDLWQSFQRQGTATEVQHIARYLLPVACSMRRWTVADALRQVLIA